MIFTALVNIAFAFLGPLGAATLLLGDWIFNAYIVVSLFEYVVPNGPAIVGNASALVPVVLNTLYSAAVPILAANYTAAVKERIPNITEYAENITEYVMNMTYSGLM
jgi:hypothetical protein